MWRMDQPLPHTFKVGTITTALLTWEVLGNIDQRGIIPEINHSISWDKIKKAMKKLANDKSPGLNNLPPDSFKAPSNQNLYASY